MVAKTQFPVPFHLLDHFIIPINVRESHWFSVHMDAKSRRMIFLDSSYAYSAADCPRQKMLLRKFYRMAWIAHAKAHAPAPSWVMHPTRITSLHPRLTELTPVMVQALGKQKDSTVDSITATVDDHIVTKWKRRGVCPWSAGDQIPDPSCHNWTQQEQPVTPQQNNFVNTYATSLTCGVYTILSSLYAVREWSINFVEQSHINNARNWIAAVCHEIKETVSLEQCKCGERNEQWGRRPAPPCSKCEKTHVRKASAGEAGTEQGRSEGKRAKCDSSGRKGERKRQNIQYPRKAAK